MGDAGNRFDRKLEGILLHGIAVYPYDRETIAIQLHLSSTFLSTKCFCVNTSYLHSETVYLLVTHFLNDARQCQLRILLLYAGQGRGFD